MKDDGETKENDQKKSPEEVELLKDLTDYLERVSKPKWVMKCNFPLLGVIDENVSSTVVLSCLANELKHQVSFDLSQYGKVIAFV